MRHASALIAIFVISGCASAGAGSGAPDMTCLSGTVGSTGADPNPEVVLRRSGEPTVRLEGELATLAQRLSGTEVELCGRSATSGGSWMLAIDELELRSVNGMEAHLGTLDRQGAEWVVVRGMSVRARLVPATVSMTLANARGKMIWVAGRADGARFAVLSYGILE